MTRHLNYCKNQIYLGLSYNIQFEYYNKEYTLGENLEDNKGDLIGKTDNIAVINGVAKTTIGNIPQKG